MNEKQLQTKLLILESRAATLLAKGLYNQPIVNHINRRIRAIKTKLNIQ